MSAKTNSGLVSHAAAQLNLPYWYGTFGQAPTLDLLNQKAKQYPKYMTPERVAIAKVKHIGKFPRVYDCAGLIKSYMYQSSPTAKPVYDAKYDKNVPGLIASCSATGAIGTLPEIPGTLVFRSTEHVGIYAGGGNVIEAKGFDYGVVKTKISAGKWDKWGKLSWLEYPASTAKKSALAKYQIIYDGKLNVRKSPNGEILRQIERGEIREIYAFNTDKTWGQLLDGGWICLKAQYAKKI
jgi:hypothetical protein